MLRQKGAREWVADDAAEHDPTWRVYARLSVAGDEDETGVDRQLSDGIKEAERRGAKRVVIYSDDGFSAYKRKMKRPAFLEMVADIEADPISGGGMVAWRVERLARQHRDMEALLEAVEAEETPTFATIYTIADGVDSSTENGLFVLRQMVTFGRWESRAISQRVTRSKVSAVEAGRFTGSPSAFGHRDGTKWREEEPAEADLIRDAAARIVAGEGVMSILRDWSGRGVNTRRGSGWQHAAFRNMIISPRMAGLGSASRLEPGVDEHGVPWIAPILDLETWRDVRRVLLDPARRPNTPGGEARHLLTNLMRCGGTHPDGRICRVPLRAKGNAGKRNGPGYWTYGCVKDPYHASACGHVWIKGGMTDDYITGVVLAHLRLPAVRAALTRGSSTTTTTDDEGVLRREALDLRERINSGEVASLEGTLEDWGNVGPEAFRQWRARALIHLDDLDKKIGRSVRSHSIVRAIADPEAFWDQATLAERRDVIRAVLPDITVVPASSIPEFPQRWMPERIRWTPAG